ncbi:hypothetical protein PHPALM_7766 [Phytophthora palmivora]|uniref:Uncharacterized protein n=1 Tax=Phytophthora palmivora TaxID=4796 RepID=A0A2P4YBH5_9STRA|nr:hypothetical protein PHPALM_7766 [Phytophthora palmivora]
MVLLISTEYPFLKEEDISARPPAASNAYSIGRFGKSLGGDHFWMTPMGLVILRPEICSAR